MLIWSTSNVVDTPKYQKDYSLNSQIILVYEKRKLWILPGYIIILRKREY